MWQQANGALAVLRRQANETVSISSHREPSEGSLNSSDASLRAHVTRSGTHGSTNESLGSEKCYQTAID